MGRCSFAETKLADTPLPCQDKRTCAEGCEPLTLGRHYKVLPSNGIYGPSFSEPPLALAPLSILSIILCMYRRKRSYNVRNPNTTSTRVLKCMWRTHYWSVQSV